MRARRTKTLLLGMGAMVAVGTFGAATGTASAAAPPPACSGSTTTALPCTLGGVAVPDPCPLNGDRRTDLSNNVAVCIPHVTLVCPPGQVPLAALIAGTPILGTPDNICVNNTLGNPPPPTCINPDGSTQIRPPTDVGTDQHCNPPVAEPPTPTCTGTACLPPPPVTQPCPDHKHKSPPPVRKHG
jgi:hypothetical protein